MANKNRRQMVDKGQITEDILQQNPEIAIQENAQNPENVEKNAHLLGTRSGTEGDLGTSTLRLSMHTLVHPFYHFILCFHARKSIYNLSKNSLVICWQNNRNFTPWNNGNRALIVIMELILYFKHNLCLSSRKTRTTRKKM